MTNPGQPFVTGDTVRSFDEVPVSYDWHDFLLNVRTPGAAIALNFAIRPPRSAATGFQWVCVLAGRAGFRTTFPWPTGVGSVFVDGAAIWNSVPVDDTSLRNTINTLVIVADSPLTTVDLGIVDLIETVLVTGFVSGNSYEVRCKITCSSPPEKKEAVMVLPCQD
jgi:hypothetical protein